MASSDQRDNERVPTFLRVRLKFADVDTFIEKYSTNVSLGGVFIQSRAPKPPGTTLRFELALESGESLIKGEGQVTWVREFDANAPGQPFGMGVRFTNLDAKSRALVDRAVAHRQSRAGTAESTPSTFTPAVPRPQARREPPPGPLTPSPVARQADVELDALMREAGLDLAKVTRAAAKATAAVGQEPVIGELGALLRRATRPPAPGAPPVTTPPPPAETPRPLARTGRSSAPDRQPTPPPAESPPAKASRTGARRPARRTPRPVDPDEEILLDAQPAPLDPPTASPFAPPPWQEARTNEPVLPVDEIDELLGSLSESSSSSAALANPGGLVGADLEIESLGNLSAISDMDGGAAPSHMFQPPEITAVGTPPRFEDTPEDEPLIFPEREVTTPPPESATAFFAADSMPTPSDPGQADGPPREAAAGAPQSVADRWAAASGPESATLDADLVAAMDSVIDHTPVDDAPVASPSPAAAGPDNTGERDSDKGKEKKSRGILGRIFRKKG